MAQIIMRLYDVLTVFLGSVASGSGGGGGFWMPSQSSEIAERVDWVFDFVLWISIFFLALITVLMVLFIIRYRAREGEDAPGSKSHNMPLEITWSIIPLIIVIFIFWFAFDVYLDMATPPENAKEILVTGQKWKWLFTYPNGYIDENLHVPVDTNIRLVMTSEDVIHSLFVPAFRVKQDVVPGRISKLWFMATEPGEFDIFCAEYCGTSHSDMLAKVVVHPAGEYEPWLDEASNFLDRMSPAEGGALLYTQRGCPQCHSVDGASGIGPTFLGLFGRERQFADGSTRVADEEYVRQSILEPQAQIVAGFEGVMPTFQGRLKDREIMAVIEYIKTLTE